MDTMEKNSTTPMTDKKPAFSTKSLTMMALFAAILCVSAYASIPTPLPGSPHITLLNFVIILVALLFPTVQSFLIILVWMLLGALGIPVFIGGGAGIGYLASPFGGYTVSFLLVALVLPLIRGKKYNRICYTITAIIGVILIDLVGMIWLQISNNLALKYAFATGFVPFIPLDLLKAIVVAQIIPPFRKIIIGEQ